MHLVQETGKLCIYNLNSVFINIAKAFSAYRRNEFSTGLLIKCRKIKFNRISTFSNRSPAPILKYRRRQPVFRTLAALIRGVNICVHMYTRARRKVFDVMHRRRLQIGIIRRAH